MQSVVLPPALFPVLSSTLLAILHPALFASVHSAFLSQSGLITQPSRDAVLRHHQSLWVVVVFFVTEARVVVLAQRATQEILNDSNWCRRH